MELIFGIESIIAGLHIATPILLAGLGGALCLRAGVLNIALEGLILIGAFTGVVGAFYLDSALLGVLTAAGVGLLFALVFALVHVSLGADEVISGLGINIFALGMTTWLLIAVWNTPGAFLQQPPPPGLDYISLPIISDIPFIGRLISGHNALDYGAWALTFILYFVMNRTPLGLRWMAVGEHPEAAETAGINVENMRYLAVALSGILAGMAGAHMSMSALNMFTEGMSAGRGFIAFTAVAFSAGRILPMALISILFGLFGSYAIRLEGFGVPTYFVQMIPYVMTILVLVISAFRARAKQTQERQAQEAS